MNDKIIFEHQDHSDNEQQFQAKQEFDQQAKIEVDNEPLEAELLDEKFDQAIVAKPRWWVRALIGVMLLFLLAIVAQSVQWLIDTWQNHQWIYFAFALVSFSTVLLGLVAIAREFSRLRQLRQRLLLQQQSSEWQHKSAVQIDTDFSVDKMRHFCDEVAKNMGLDEQHTALIQWKKQISLGHNAQEVGFLFSQNVLLPVDQKAKQLITKNAIESAVVVSISPLAVVDVFFIAWRNIRLINQIAQLYGMELGYFSRLRLMKLVLLNMALTGATELVQEMGMDWLSQDIAAKLSARVAQGIGAGLLTARLGVKAMEFCRPMAFSRQEKPKLAHIQRELLSHLKSTILNPLKIKQSEKM
ncbi:TIGR01620 family protein [Pasteurellaceae bacterium 22721_9_1]